MNSALRTGLLAFACLLPFMLIVMQGPSVSGTLLLGASLPIYHLHRLGIRAHWKTAGLMLAVLAPYVVLTWWIPDPYNELKFHYTVLAVLYGVPAGMYFACLAHADDEAPARIALVLLGLIMAMIAFYLSQLIGAGDFVNVTGTGFERENLDERIDYFGFFFTEDLNIGIIPFTLFALAATIGLFQQTSRATTFLILAAASIAAMVNFIVLTRTALVCSIVAVLLGIALNFRQIRERSLRRITLFGLLAVAATGAAFLVPSQPVREEVSLRTQAMTERLAETTEDGRLIHWQEAVKRIIDSPAGNSRSELTTHIWAHNLFLDIGLSTGVVGMLAMMAALAVPILRTAAVIRAGHLRSSPLFQLLLCQFGAVLLATQISPPNLPYLVFVSFFTGYVHSLPKA